MRVRCLAASLLAIAAGCTEDVGECFNNGVGGLDTVVRGTHVEYAGQAILNTACAVGCHNSGAKGADRHGAPAGLDFDLNPIDASGLDSATDRRGRSFAQLGAEDLAGLRERQRVVFTERNLLWAQVKEGLMPPGGSFRSFWKLASIFDSDEASPCTRGDALPDVDSKRAHDMLRNWLACQAPIVESYGGPVEEDRVYGRAGYQYLACEDDGGGDVTLTSLMADEGVLSTSLCIACHPGSARDYPLDLSSLDEAYTTLLDPDNGCDGKPYVTPNMPDQSFLLDVLTLDDPGCDIAKMPKGLPALSASQIAQVRTWIESGAPR